MTMIRLGFVSNSSSSSFVIPKKNLTKEELDLYQECRWDSMNDEDTRETEHYIYGRVKKDNVLNDMFKKHIEDEDVDYYES
jgi:hypothetical protein